MGRRPAARPADHRSGSTPCSSTPRATSTRSSAILLPRAGVVTRRVVAINAVLAGCKPEYFPVVLTATRALAHPDVNLRGVNATTHSVAPLVIVSGDVVRECGFNFGVGAFGPGNRANATVGRAVRLMMLHVAGALPGSGDASSQGQPAKYTYCVAENTDDSPWESYPVSVGIDAPSTVTVHCGEGPHNVHDAEAEGLRRPHPRQDRVRDDIARHEQRVHQRRVLHRSRARARERVRPARDGAQRCLRLLVQRRRACRPACSTVTSRNARGTSG